MDFRSMFLCFCSLFVGVHRSQAPLTLLVPCAPAVRGAEDRLLGATLEGLLVLQLRLDCEPGAEEPRVDGPVLRRVPRPLSLKTFEKVFEALKYKHKHIHLYI